MDNFGRLVDSRGRLTSDGRLAMSALTVALGAIVTGHNDNTGASCRIDLDGHDCCYTCNAAELALRAYADLAADTLLSKR